MAFLLNDNSDQQDPFQAWKTKREEQFSYTYRISFCEHLKMLEEEKKHHVHIEEQSNHILNVFDSLKLLHFPQEEYLVGSSSSPAPGICYLSSGLKETGRSLRV